MDEMQFWWCGWTVPSSVPLEAMAERWPTSMRGWRSGEGAAGEVWAGLVWAASAEDARQVVASCYGECAGEIVERWEPEPKGETWTPTRRFPASVAQIEALKGGTR